MKMPAMGTMSLKEHPKGHTTVNYINIESCGHSARGDVMYILIFTYITYDNISNWN